MDEEFSSESFGDSGLQALQGPEDIPQVPDAGGLDAQIDFTSGGSEEFAALGGGESFDQSGSDLGAMNPDFTDSFASAEPTESFSVADFPAADFGESMQSSAEPEFAMPSPAESAAPAAEVPDLGSGTGSENTSELIATAMGQESHSGGIFGEVLGEFGHIVETVFDPVTDVLEGVTDLTGITHAHKAEDKGGGDAQDSAYDTAEKVMATEREASGTILGNLR